MEKASMLISKGSVIAVPTDTVYGLVCDFYSSIAVEKIYTLKQRTFAKPLVAFCRTIEDIEELCIEIPDTFYILAQRFFPGPITIVLKKNKSISHYPKFEKNTLAVRIPENKFTLKLLEMVKIPLASTSANKSDMKSSLNAAEVHKTFSRHIPLIIDGGDCPIGIESTVIDLSGKKFKILREGTVKKEQLKKYIPDI